jgi:hypothetical protein
MSKASSGQERRTWFRSRRRADTLYNGPSPATEPSAIANYNPLASRGPIAPAGLWLDAAPCLTFSPTAA